MSNHLKSQVSPYLLQHAENPVDWYPWCEEAFERAKIEDRPIFLSIGYSTCHWCHVMAHESFEDEETAGLLNESFISIKVDKEERPDIDAIYMAICQAFTGSGGWPTSIFMTPEQKPFFAGTYFPSKRKFNTVGFQDLLCLIRDKWNSNRESLIRSAEEIVSALERENTVNVEKNDSREINKGENPGNELIQRAFNAYTQIYDSIYGGFGNAPKFPTPHVLLFLLTYYEKAGDRFALEMVEKTLQQMYRGGIFDHIGYGFSRYSTDRFFLVPHFEKMLYDNALLIMAYSKAYEVTKKYFYKEIAECTAEYILREMTAKEGGFFSAQDADSEGEEGKYYVFTPDEIVKLLGAESGSKFNANFDITAKGSFEGQSIPNLLQHTPGAGVMETEEIKEKPNQVISLEALKGVYNYRKKRYQLHLDDKILISWNGLMIGAMCWLYRISGNQKYLLAAEGAENFISKKLREDNTLFVSYRNGQRGAKGFLEEYACYIFALLSLYDATLQEHYLEQAKQFIQKVIDDFWDPDNKGFFLYGAGNEKLIIRPKETYDGAIPSGNSIMAYNLVRLTFLEEQEEFASILEEQISFMCGQVSQAPTGYGMFLFALSDYLESPALIKVVPGGQNRGGEQEQVKNLSLSVPLQWIVKVLSQESTEYPLLNGETTYYICKNHSCLTPINHLEDWSKYI